MVWDNLGLARDKVELLPHQTTWVHAFAEEKASILEQAAQYIQAIAHVGSTAVPQLHAKPILDIAISLKAGDVERDVVPKIVQLGYEYKGEHGIAGRLYFVKRQDGKSLVHIHAFPQGHPHVLELIAFRDYLLAHAEARDAYQALKMRLQTQYKHDRPAYTSAKHDFIQSILQKISIAQNTERNPRIH